MKMVEIAAALDAALKAGRTSYEFEKSYHMLIAAMETIHAATLEAAKNEKIQPTGSFTNNYTVRTLDTDGGIGRSPL